MGLLTGRVAVVAGATRGVGRGIAAMLGEAGATVYCTGRSVAGRPPASGHYQGRRETIEETADLVTRRGGIGRAARVDHGRVEDVERLASAIVAEERRLDILVLDFWGDESPVPFGTPFWEIPAGSARYTIDSTLWPHVITLRALTPLMLHASGPPPPLIVEVTDGPALYYRASLFYDLAAMLRARLAYAVAEDLHAHGITAVAVSPGYVRTELALEAHGVTEANWRDAPAGDEHWRSSESPHFVGRGIAALAADPESLRWSGGLVGSWTLAAAYGVTDVDGSRPDFGRHLAARETMFPARTGARWRLTHDRLDESRTPEAAHA